MINLHYQVFRQFVKVDEFYISINCNAEVEYYPIPMSLTAFLMVIIIISRLIL
jgi:hypothetical protein